MNTLTNDPTTGTLDRYREALARGWRAFRENRDASEPKSEPTASEIVEGVDPWWSGAEMFVAVFRGLLIGAGFAVLVLLGAPIWFAAGCALVAFFVGGGSTARLEIEVEELQERVAELESEVFW